MRQRPGDLSTANRLEDPYPFFYNLSCMARQRVEFGRDPGLTARMLLTIFLLGLLYVALVAGALLVGQFFLSDKLGLASMGAKVVTPDQAPGFHAMIERLCIQAD